MFRKIIAIHFGGIKPSEVLHLRAQDFDPVQKTITICGKWVQKKGGRLVWWRPKTEGSGDTLAIGGRLTKVLWDWNMRRLATFARDEDRQACEWLFPNKSLRGPWTTGGPGLRPLDRVVALGVRAGVPSLRCKSGRKGIGTHKAIGLTPMERRFYFRHADVETGDAYDDEHVESMRDAARKIERFYLG